MTDGDEVAADTSVAVSVSVGISSSLSLVLMSGRSASACASWLWLTARWFARSTYSSFSRHQPSCVPAVKLTSVGSRALPVSRPRIRKIYLKPLSLHDRSRFSVVIIDCFIDVPVRPSLSCPSMSYPVFSASPLPLVILVSSYHFLQNLEKDHHYLEI